VYKDIFIDAKLTNGNIGQKNRGDLEKSIKEAKVRIGLQCYLTKINNNNNNNDNNNNNNTVLCFYQ
jgi:hypothetical protein